MKWDKKKYFYTVNMEYPVLHVSDDKISRLSTGFYL